MSYAIPGIAACIAVQLLATASLQAAPLADFRLQVEDLSDNPIATVNLGQDFQLAAYVEDIRDPVAQFPGVWSAFMNVAYELGRVSITSMPPNPVAVPGNFGDPGIEWGSFFALGLRMGNMSTPGEINGIGAASFKLQPSGLGEVLLWRITIHTAALGTVTFSPTYDTEPDHETLFLDPLNPLTAEQIRFTSDSVQIVPEPSSFVLAALGLFGLVVGRRRKGSGPSGVAINRRPRSRCVVLTLCAFGVMFSTKDLNAGTIVSFDFTNFGSVQVELFDSEAPLTVANFLNYVTAARYNDTMIHRVDTGLGVVQGGGFTKTTVAVATAADPMIPLEYSHPNARGTLAMARTSSPNSATSQWYFNTHDNSTLLGPSNGGGYAVFGQVLGNGMDVIDAIAAVPTFPYSVPFGQIPLQNFSIADFNNHVSPLPHVVVLNSVSIVPEPSSFVLAGLGLIGLVVWRRRRR